MTTTPLTRRPSSADHEDASTGPRSTDAAWRIVAGREIMVKLRDRNFIISTLTTIAIFIVAFGVSFLLGGDDGEKRIAVVSGDAVTIVEQTNVRADAADGEDTDSSATAGAPTVRLGIEQVADPAATSESTPRSARRWRPTRSSATPRPPGPLSPISPRARSSRSVSSRPTGRTTRGSR